MIIELLLSAVLLFICRLYPDHLGGCGFRRAPKRFLGYFAHHDLSRKVKGHFAGYRPVFFFGNLYKQVLDGFLFSFWALQCRLGQSAEVDIDGQYFKTVYIFDFYCKSSLFSGNNSPTVGKRSLKTGKSKPGSNCQASIFRWNGRFLKLFIIAL